MSKYVTQLMALYALSILTAACSSYPGMVAYKNAIAQQQAQEAQRRMDLAPIEERERRVRELQQPIKVGETIPSGFAEAQLRGAWKGSTCKERVTVEVTMSIQGDIGMSPTPTVMGVFRSSDRSQEPNARVVQTGLKGQFNRNTGFLTMTSIPKSLTEEEQKEENRLRTQEAAEFNELKRKLDLNMIQAMTESSRVTPDQRERVSREYGMRGKTLAEQMQKISTIQSQRAEAQTSAAKAALVPFQIDMARNMDGSGWAGVIDGVHFDGCEIVLTSEQGVRTDKLPPITSQVALTRAKYQNYPTPVASQGYWLNIAAKDAREEDFFLLGQLYERQGERASENYVRAVDYYRFLVDKNGDARAQGNLGQLYEKGLGIPKNSLEAQRLYNLATATRKKALDVCASPKTKVLASRMMNQAQKNSQVLGLLLQLYSGIRMDLGNIRMIAIEAEDVASVDKPFTCNFMARRIDPRVDAESVADGHYVENQYGNVRYEDNSLDKAFKSLQAASLEQDLSRPFRNPIRIEPQGNLHYKLIWNDQVLKDSAIVDLN